MYDKDACLGYVLAIVYVDDILLAFSTVEAENFVVDTIPEKPTILSKYITNVLNTKQKHAQQLTSTAKALAHLLRALSGP